MLALIDNYDSFTYNLLHYLQELGAEVEVYRNDALSAKELLGKNPEAVIMSPGPGTPDQSGICLDFIKESEGNIPVLGVCLGHQVIAQSYGGKIVRTTPVHGKTSAVSHKNVGVFKNLPSPFKATRYHSLIVERQSLPSCFEITAENSEGIIMGIMHKELPLHGVQFHPESIASEYGHETLKNFLDLLPLRKAAA